MILMLVSVLLLVMFAVLTMVRSNLMVVFRIDCMQIECATQW